MDLGTLMSHITYIISALTVSAHQLCLLSEAVLQKQRQLEMCRAVWHIRAGIGMSHTCSFSNGKPPSCAMSPLPSAKSQFKERCVTCLPHTSKTHMPRGKSCCKPLLMFWISILYLGFLFLLPHGANKWRKIVSILHTCKHQISKASVRPVTLQVYAFLTIHTESGFCIPSC